MVEVLHDVLPGDLHEGGDGADIHASILRNLGGLVGDGHGLEVLHQVIINHLVVLLIIKNYLASGSQSGLVEELILVARTLVEANIVRVQW